MEFIKAVLIVYAGFSVVFTTFFLINLFRNIRRELDVIDGVKSAAKTLKIVYVEHSNGIYRMYDKTNNHFICQAVDEIELWKIAREKFPDKQVITLDADKEAKQV